MRKPWTNREICWFLSVHYAHTAEDLAKKCERSTPAIMAMRRKLKRLRELGARADELPSLLAVSNWSVERCGLREIRCRARIQETLVRNFVRRNRVTGRPLLVSEHRRNKVVV